MSRPSPSTTRGLSVGLTYYYIVRANDSRSGEDANTVVRFASAADVVAPVFGGIGYSSPGYSCGETVISWLAGSDCTGPIRYDIYRSLDPLFTPSAANHVGESTSTAFIDAALQAGTAYTYVVRARDAVGNSDTNLVRATMAAYTAPAGCSGCGAPAPVGRFSCGGRGSASCSIGRRTRSRPRGTSSTG